MNRLFILLVGWFLLCQINLNGQEIVYNGLVSDINTGENLVFVSISRNDHDGGTTTNLDGHFSLDARLGDTLYFSYVGYAEQTFILKKEYDLHIQLTPQTATLEEIVVRPGENPAWRIIREVLAHRKENAPQNYDGYSYNAYHKTVMSMDSISTDKTWEPFKDPVKKKQQEAIAKAKKMRRLFNKEMHLWVTESFTKTHFRHSSQHKEEILAYESSMPNDFTGGLNPIDFQPFGFYQELIRVEFTDQNYVNPISRSCFQHYSFELKDTLFHSIDTTFVIAFKPLKGKNFVALKGLLYINTYGYAIENVIASSADKNQTLQFEIQQQSSLVNGRWFPKQLNTDLFIEMGIQDRFIIYAFRNRSLITEVKYEVPDKKVFNHYLRENNASSATLPDRLRPLPLSERERNTYTYWDSLPDLRRPYRFLKSYNGLIKIVATGLLQTPIVDVVIPDLIQYNESEGFRLGLGIQTSSELLKHHTFYGYGAYGLKDKKWKYGGAWDLKLYPHRGLRLRASYSKDIVEPAAFNFLSAVNRPWSGFNSRNFILSRLDDIEKWKVDLFYRPHPAWQLNFFIEKEERKPNYDYHFFEIEGRDLQKFNMNQIGINIRWSPKEKLVKMNQMEAILYPAYPVIDFAATYGQLETLGLSFLKIAARLEHEIRWKYLGTTTINLEVGYLDTPLPYSYLFQVAGNNSNGLAAKSTFNTAGVTEFVNQEYTYAFITHNFGHLLGKPDKFPWFRPELSLIQNIGWGKNHSLAVQHSWPLKDFSKTYLESGVSLKNILRFPYFKTMYIGVGGAAYYRWGAYNLPVFEDNLFFQFLLTISV